MDKKQLSQLDPKLKETYERIMGISSTPGQRPTPFAPKPVSPIASAQPIAPQPFQPQPLQPNKASFQATENTNPNAKEVYRVYPNQSIPAPPPIVKTQPIQNQPIQKPQTQNKKKKSKILPVLMGFGGTIFLIGYTLFWIKFFNLKVPFLPF